MMVTRDEEAELARAELLGHARELAKEWGYWCTRTNVRTGFEPFMSTGGIERYYRAPPQWHPPQPRMPEANENLGLRVQRAFIHLPQVYRLALRSEFCYRPWLVVVDPEEGAQAAARKARLSTGAYAITVDRALLALVNVMKRRGLWERA